MLAHSFKVVRPALASRLRASGASATLSKRTLITPTPVRQADLVQELYLQELRRYRPPPLKASDAEGHVQKFTVPKPPRSPEEGDIASELKAYEEQQVEVEGQAGAEEEVRPPMIAWFEDGGEDEEEKAARLNPDDH
ncbi:MAG: hypothetical protein M1826_004828 [Phylliscum demangeonii]|nr:MAG: hypothetical protein M1826_004828 [Phylliscum demangeonii]